MHKNTLFVHVGPHKTGTTLFQKSCLQNKETLLENGVYYPTEQFSHFGHHPLIDTIRERCVDEQVVNQIIKPGLNTLISSENFIHLNASDWEYFKQSLAELVDFKIIIAWRRTSEKLYSNWQESIKQGDVCTFSDFYFEDFIRPFGSEALNPSLKIKMLASTFGKENLCIVDFNASKHNNSLMEDLYQLVNLEHSKLSPVQDNTIKNTSMSPEIIEVIRSLNVVFQKNHNLHGPLCRELFLSNHPYLEPQLAVILDSMKGCKTFYSIGNYLIDRATEQEIRNVFSDQLYNYSEFNQAKNIYTINSSWMLDRKAQQAFEQIYQYLLTKLND
ncbi:hypothetical protein R7040_08740 [Vibrio sp. 1069]|uniref:hypothetical protein n=1 Tax=Vibrio TaxID=662 RepID=UPI001A8F5A02|nr:MULTISPECIES: hypothetical protein [Vibrio]MBO0162908.1 hypothetical protein [Vibrio alginolyticus]MDW2331185.1 hypothetical protein [Vibrio sp. 1069]HCZ9264367.1 hypothetical protein [Vibrio alginolyticus]